VRRLDQLLANLGYCSRREAKRWLDQQRVTVRGQPVDDPGMKPDPAEVRVDGEALDHPDGLLLLLNKPLGLVCSHDVREGPNIFSLLPERWRARNPVVTSVGRLDKETSGAILLTDQSHLVHRLTSPRHKVPKLYEVVVDRDLEPGLVGRFARGDLVLTGEKAPCAPAELRLVDSRRAELVLIEGKYHQVRRMFASQGWHVETLHRKRFGDLEVEDLPPGTWREIPRDHFQYDA
jgi:16S rRNA pseudouridine516 synthase